MFPRLRNDFANESVVVVADKNDAQHQFQSSDVLAVLGMQEMQE